MSKFPRWLKQDVIRNPKWLVISRHKIVHFFLSELWATSNKFNNLLNQLLGDGKQNRKKCLHSAHLPYLNSSPHLEMAALSKSSIGIRNPAPIAHLAQAVSWHGGPIFTSAFNTKTGGILDDSVAAPLKETLVSKASCCHVVMLNRFVLKQATPHSIGDS